MPRPPCRRRLLNAQRSSSRERRRCRRVLRSIPPIAAADRVGPPAPCRPMGHPAGLARPCHRHCRGLMPCRYPAPRVLRRLQWVEIACRREPRIPVRPFSRARRNRRCRIGNCPVNRSPMRGRRGPEPHPLAPIEAGRSVAPRQSSTRAPGLRSRRSPQRRRGPRLNPSAAHRSVRRLHPNRRSRPAKWRHRDPLRRSLGRRLRHLASLSDRPRRHAWPHRLRRVCRHRHHLAWPRRRPDPLRRCR